MLRGQRLPGVRTPQRRLQDSRDSRLKRRDDAQSNPCGERSEPAGIENADPASKHQTHRKTRAQSGAGDHASFDTVLGGKRVREPHEAQPATHEGTERPWRPDRKVPRLAVQAEQVHRQIALARPSAHAGGARHNLFAQLEAHSRSDCPSAAPLRSDVGVHDRAAGRGRHCPP